MFRINLSLPGYVAEEIIGILRHKEASSRWFAIRVNYAISGTANRVHGSTFPRKTNIVFRQCGSGGS
jgi:hypothetical protein